MSLPTIVDGYYLRRIPDHARPRRDTVDDHRAGFDEGPIADFGPMLGRTIIIAGDRARPDIGILADLRVADIGEMVRLRAGADRARLHLDEIADVDVFGQLRARSEPRVRTDAAVAADVRLLEVAERLDPGARVDAHVAEHAVRAERHAVAQDHVALEYAVDIYRDVAPALELPANVDAGGIGERDACREQSPRGPVQVVEFQTTEYGAVVSSAPIEVPSTLNWTPAMPSGWLAVADTVTAAPDTVAANGLHGALLLGAPQEVARLGPVMEALEKFSLVLSCDGQVRDSGVDGLIKTLSAKNKQSEARGKT